MKTQRSFILFALLALMSMCAACSKDVRVVRYGVKFAIPKGWKLKQNDQNKEGALCVLQQEAKDRKGPTMALWFGDYSNALGRRLGLSSGETMIRATLAGMDTEASTKTYTTDYSHLFDETTKRGFLDFRSSESPLVVSVLLAQHASAVDFFITVAASPDAIAATKRLADDIAGDILPQLGPPAKKGTK